MHRVSPFSLLAGCLALLTLTGCPPATEAALKKSAPEPATNTATSAVAADTPAKSVFPFAIDPQTGNRVYQLTDRPGNNMALYYIFDNHGMVDGVPYLAYRNARGSARDDSKMAYYSINLATGGEVQLSQTGGAGNIAEVRGEYLYALSRGGKTSGEYSNLSRYHLATGEREDILALPTDRRFSANLAVDAAGELILFFSPSGDPGRIDLFAARIANGTSFTVLENEPISHIQFSPAIPGYFTFLNQPSRRAKKWTAVGVGDIDVETGRSTHFLLDPQDAFFLERDRELVASHPFFDADGQIMVDFVDTSRPYTDEFVIRLIPDWENPGQLKSFDYVNLEMGDFQTHFRPGPNARLFVGDGESADWWHKPGFGEPYIQKLEFNYETHEMKRTFLAKAVGTHWKSGQLEPNARYHPGAGFVIWNAFMTLDGQEAKMTQYATVEERPEREESWLYTDENPIKQNVFAVEFFPTPSARTGQNE